MEKEYLDFCRVKKLFDKGFGFLTSMYYRENAFFHFSKIKDLFVKEKFEQLKRGEVYLYYTSRLVDGKRKVNKMWFDPKDAPPELLPTFIATLTEQVNGSRINIYELANVVRQFREAELLNRIQFEKVLMGLTVRKIPNTILAMLSNAEKESLPELEELIEEVRNEKQSYEKLTAFLLEKLY